MQLTVFRKKRKDRLHYNGFFKTYINIMKIFITRGIKVILKNLYVLIYEFIILNYK